MNESMNSKHTHRQSKDRFWIVEVIALIAVVPALVAGVSALNLLPMV